jgi:hypothetical protein
MTYRNRFLSIAGVGAVLFAVWFCVAALSRLSMLEQAVGRLAKPAQESAVQPANRRQWQTTNASATEIIPDSPSTSMRHRAGNDTTDVGVRSGADLATRMARLERQLDLLLERLPSVAEEVNPSEDDLPEKHTQADAEALVDKLGRSPSAQQLAATLTTIESWIVAPAEEQAFGEYKATLLPRLRAVVKKEVLACQKRALAAETGAAAAEKHAEGERLLLLYPMSDDNAVLDEVRQLSVKQAEIAARIMSIRRLRYNRWATDRIEGAINGYNENKSYLNPLKENPALVASLVKNLGEVDPSLIEPAVLDLYNYVIDETKGNISLKDKLELAKRLTDPAIARKTLGDF